MTPATRERDRWVQACLQRLIAPTLTVDGALGPRSHQALKDFQRRVGEFVPGARPLTVDGQVGPATIAALAAATGTAAPGSPQAKPAASRDDMAEGTGNGPVSPRDDMAEGTGPTAGVLRTAAVAREVAEPRVPPPAGGYVERRVSVRVYGTIGRDSRLLVPVPGVGGPRHLHVLAAQGLARMAEAAREGLGLELKLASAWRAHRWQSRAQYEAVLVAKYGSIAEGKRWLAFDSPHETGLAIDLGVGGLTPSRASVDFQRVTPLHAWLVARAWEFGFHPYKVEPWHWEYPLSLKAYRSGELAADDPGPPVEAVSFGLDDEEEDAVLEDTDLGELPD